MIEHELAAAVIKVTAALLDCPAHEKVIRLNAVAEELRPELREPVKMLYLLGNGSSQERSEMRRESNRQNMVVFVVGVGLLLLLVAITLAVADPTQSQERVITVVLGLAAGAFGALLPGSLAVEGQHPTVGARATGAIALAVFVILIYRFLL